jgi:hypothetical protein
MDEVRLKRLENDVTMLNRRVTDHDALHADSDARHKLTSELVAAVKKTTDSHDELATIAREVIDLLKQLIKYLSWVGVVAKWVSTVVVAFTATWHLIKWAMAKMWIFS